MWYSPSQCAAHNLSEEGHSSTFPATSFQLTTWGTAAPHGGSYGYVISNHAYGYLVSEPIEVEAGAVCDLSAYVRGELDPDDSEGYWLVRASFYDGGGGSLGYTNAASGVAGSLGGWQLKAGSVSVPEGAATIRIYLYNSMNSGWVDFDDVALTHTAVRSTYYAGAQPAWSADRRVAMRQGGTLYYLLVVRSINLLE